MGFMTEVSILNDRWSEIRQNPQKFVDEIYDASLHQDLHQYRYGYITGQTTVLPTHHADDMRVLYAARNSFLDAYPTRGMSKEQLESHLNRLKQMASYLKVAKEATKRELEKFKE